MKFVTLKVKTLADDDFVRYLSVEQIKELLDYIAYLKLESAGQSDDEDYRMMMFSDASALRTLVFEDYLD